MENEIIRPYKAELRLRNEQRIDANHWKLTFKGEIMVIPDCCVSYYTMTLPEAIKVIRPEELISIHIWHTLKP